MNEPQQVLPAVPFEERIDLRAVFRVLWEGKWLIGGLTFAGAVIAVIIALMLPNIYRAEALLAPNQDQGAGGLSALAAQYGGLASLAGIDLANESSDKTALGLEILKSRKFISEFVNRHDILVPLMATKGWNAETGELRIDPDIYDVSGKKWMREVKPPRKAVPSSQESYRVFREAVLSVTQDKKTGFVTIAVEHYSPTVAKQWVDWLVEDINATIVRQDVDEAEQAIAYLEEQIAATSLAELRNVFFKLIEEQTKTVMLAKVSSEYMFRTLDPAVAPELKVRPKRKLIVILGLILGGTIGLLIVMLRGNASRQSA